MKLLLLSLLGGILARPTQLLPRSVETDQHAELPPVKPCPVEPDSDHRLADAIADQISHFQHVDPLVYYVAKEAAQLPASQAKEFNRILISLDSHHPTPDPAARIDDIHEWFSGTLHELEFVHLGHVANLTSLETVSRRRIARLIVDAVEEETVTASAQQLLQTMARVDLAMSLQKLQSAYASATRHVQEWYVDHLERPYLAAKAATELHALKGSKKA